MEEPVERTLPLTRAALGRPFQLGMLYDCRSDAPVTGLSLWGKKSLEAVQTMSKEYSKVDVIMSDDLDSKTLGINARTEVKLSLLCGMIDVSGSAEFFKDYKKSKRHSRMVLHYHSTSRFEQLVVPEKIEHDVIGHNLATHVVTGILYGADAYFVFDHEISEESDKMKIEGQLKAALKMLPKGVSGNVTGTYSSLNYSLTNSLKCKFYGDVKLDHLPVTYDQAVKAYRDIVTNKVSIPQKVWLLPLTAFDTKAPSYVKNVSNALLARAQKALEDFRLITVAATDLLYKLKGKRALTDTRTAATNTNNNFSALFDYLRVQIKHFSSMVDSHTIDFMSAMKSLLPKLRDGAMPSQQDKLVDLVVKMTKPPFDAESLTSWLDKKENEAQTLFNLLSFKGIDSVTLVTMPGDLNKVIIDNSDAEIIILELKILSRADKYLEWMANPQDAWYRNDEALTSWFQEPLTVVELRDKMCSLAAFAGLNESRSIKCVFTHFADEDVGDKDVATFKRCTHDTDDMVFDIPSKPKGVTVDDKTRDSITLSWEEPLIGRANVSHYEVYVDGSRMCDEIGHTCTVNGLEPGSEHQITVHAACDMGLCEGSEELLVTLFKVKE